MNHVALRPELAERIRTAVTTHAVDRGISEDEAYHEVESIIGRMLYDELRSSSPGIIWIGGEPHTAWLVEHSGAGRTRKTAREELKQREHYPPRQPHDGIALVAPRRHGLAG